MAHFFFFLLAFVSVAAIVAMIITKNQAYSALFVILAFVCTGGLFALIGAPFIATVQIIIYAGAVMILFVFVIMMINIRKGLPPEKKKWTVYLSLAVALVFVVELILAVRGSLSSLTASEGFASGPKELGRLLFTKYLYAFEITSVLIIAALVGAVVLVKKRDKE